MDRNQQLVLLVISAVILFTAGYKVAGWYGARDGKSGNESVAVPAVVYESSREIVVHVSGAVEKPGVYRFSRETRVSEALEKAVPVPKADIQGLNLAAPLKDGQKIVVPEKRDGSQDVAFVPQTPAPAVKPAGRPAKVNINRAGAGDLESLPGVGPALAQRIIRHRETRGLFTSEEDVKNVPGIGEKLYEQIKDSISVD
ncbi:MAG: helix-hairpin-helix domain-containing protein [Bacillota bacterium]